MRTRKGSPRALRVGRKLVQPRGKRLEAPPKTKAGRNDLAILANARVCGYGHAHHVDSRTMTGSHDWPSAKR